MDAHAQLLAHAQLEIEEVIVILIPVSIYLSPYHYRKENLVVNGKQMKVKSLKEFHLYPLGNEK